MMMKHKNSKDRTTDSLTFTSISVLISYADFGAPLGLIALVNYFTYYRLFSCC